MIADIAMSCCIVVGMILVIAIVVNLECVVGMILVGVVVALMVVNIVRMVRVIVVIFVVGDDMFFVLLLTSILLNLRQFLSSCL